MNSIELESGDGIAVTFVNNIAGQDKIKLNITYDYDSKITIMNVTNKESRSSSPNIYVIPDGFIIENTNAPHLSIKDYDNDRINVLIETVINLRKSLKYFSTASPHYTYILFTMQLIFNNIDLSYIENLLDSEINELIKRKIEQEI